MLGPSPMLKGKRINRNQLGPPGHLRAGKELCRLGEASSKPLEYLLVLIESLGEHVPQHEQHEVYCFPIHLQPIGFVRIGRGNEDSFPRQQLYRPKRQIHQGGIQPRWRVVRFTIRNPGREGPAFPSHQPDKPASPPFNQMGFRSDPGPKPKARTGREIYSRLS